MIIKIEKVEIKTSKAGNNYALINSYYTVHEKNDYRKLEDNIGKSYECNVKNSDDGKWHNIRGIGAEIDETPEVSQPIK